MVGRDDDHCAKQKRLLFVAVEGAQRRRFVLCAILIDRRIVGQIGLADEAGL
jgi:hypothetical protein